MDTCSSPTEVLIPPPLSSPHKGDRASRWKNTVYHTQVVWPQAVCSLSFLIPDVVEHYLRLVLAPWPLAMGKVVMRTLLGRK